MGTAAETHKWLEVSDKNDVEDLEKKDVLPRFFFARMISSNSRMEGSSDLRVSRSWMNSLKAIVKSQRHLVSFKTQKIAYLVFV